MVCYLQLERNGLDMERIKRHWFSGNVYKEEERLDWESALLVDGSRYRHLWEGEHSSNVYATKLSVRDNPAASFYTYLRFSGDRPSVDIPLYDSRGTKEQLVEEFYTSATFFGEIDREKFEELATYEYALDKIMAYMNQQLVGASHDQTPEWFYDTFGVDHLLGSKDAYIGSHGGRDSFSATIELDFRNRSKDALIDPDTFVQKTNAAFPHLMLSPLPKAEYLQAIESTLPFLPKDWDV